MAREAKIRPSASTASPSRPGRMTYEEFLAWAYEDTFAEWVDGEVVWMSPVSDEHQQVGRFLLVLFTHFVEAHPLGVIEYDPFQMKTGTDLPGRAPDILFVANENLARLKRTHLDGPADLVVEIVSPDKPERDRVEKLAEYEQGGVREYWLIGLPLKEASFYQLGDDGTYHLASLDENGIFRSKVLPAFWLKLEWLWQDPRPPVLSVLREWGLI